MAQLYAALSVPILDSNSCTALTDLLIDLQIPLVNLAASL